MLQSNVIALPDGARERIEAAVEAAFERQMATTIAFSAIPSNRGQEGPCQDMLAGLLRERGYEVDDWIIDQDELKSLPGYGPVENIHGFNERVELESLKKVTKTLALFIAGWCGVEAAGT